MEIDGQFHVSAPLCQRKQPWYTFGKKIIARDGEENNSYPGQELNSDNPVRN
jgi:hypothetical protein